MSTIPYSLLGERWLPFRTRDGGRRWIAPHEIVDDTLIAPDWGRADIDAATYEFLIGLLATAYAPENLSQWADRFKTPPPPEALQQSFSRFAAAFELDGDQSRFMQDFDVLDGEARPVSALLIESPGAKTESDNGDLFQKRGRIACLGMPAAAMALFALQTYASVGGKGFRVSLRGGGPLTTLALPPAEHDTLWRRLYLNVPYQPQPIPEDLARIFGWMAPTRTSEGANFATGPDDIHPLAAFWGAPRRIRLNFSNADDVRCDLTGEPAARSVATHQRTPYGACYRAVKHPLSPMYRTKPDAKEWLFVHPQPGGLTYHDWVDLALSESGKSLTRRPAEAILTARERLRALRLGRSARLAVSGYDMKDATARGFVESVYPLFALSSPEANAALDDAARRLAAGAAEIAYALTYAVREALNLKSGKTIRLGSLRESFFADTGEDFFAAVSSLAGLLEIDPESSEALSAVGRAFLDESLGPTAFRLFDSEAPLDLLGSETGAQRVIKARRDLQFTLTGWGKRGPTVFERLGLPLPESKASKAKARPKEGRTTMNANANANIETQNPGSLALQWWGGLQPNPDTGYPGDKAALARLRRADPQSAMMEETTLLLFHRLGRRSPSQLPRIATLAGVLAHVRTYIPTPFGVAVGRTSIEDKTPPVMSALRFKSLLAAEDEDEIARGFRRAVALLRGEANVADLARILLFWDDEATRRRLTFTYYGAGGRAVVPASPDGNPDNNPTN